MAKSCNLFSKKDFNVLDLRPATTPLELKVMAYSDVTAERVLILYCNSKMNLFVLQERFKDDYSLSYFTDIKEALCIYWTRMNTYTQKLLTLPQDA